VALKPRHAGTVGRANTGARAVEELLYWTGSAAGADRRIPFLDGDLAGYAGVVLGLLGPQHADATFEALLSRIPSVSGLAALPVVGEALRTAVPAGPPPPDVLFAGMNKRQRRLITTLVASPDTWLINGTTFANFSAMIRGYGLPSDHHALRAFAPRSFGGAHSLVGFGRPPADMPAPVLQRPSAR
jgi:hypothetical protein